MQIKSVMKVKKNYAGMNGTRNADRKIQSQKNFIEIAEATNFVRN